MKRILAVLVCIGFAAAQAPQVHGSLAWGFGAHATPGLPPLAEWGLSGHLEGRYEVGAFSVEAVLDPSFRALPSGEGQAVLGLREAFLRYRSPRFDVTLGKLRFPLETGRLLLPFALDEVSAAGVRQGVWAAQVDAFFGATRLGVALAYRDAHWVPLLRAQRSFGSLDLSGNALYVDGRAAVSLGGSGLVGTLVAHGEAWGFTAPFEGRVLVGLNGFLNEALWTLEGAWIPCRPQVAGQLLLPLSETDLLAVDGRALLKAESEGHLTIQLSRALADGEYALALLGGFGPGSPTYGVRVETRSFF
ncbi:hypothetical protein [Marinithermus hydrothermalis]|uniref:Uncharacterized protein n=1 Tax=Marinithermus hydrothermalis (strain DSM 14884 / JCM 11576 / T1) TaxID=869210 RepID=F2NP52_MARHT|nr:hypothetical protein [Marinithermus hydrothermalis]AEB11853.1 hypothetical protein Marky_1111 [Marinithermus hydrothermalis DSM 14884]